MKNGNQKDSRRFKDIQKDSKRFKKKSKKFKKNQKKGNSKEFGLCGVCWGVGSIPVGWALPTILSLVQ